MGLAIFFIHLSQSLLLRVFTIQLIYLLVELGLRYRIISIFVE